MQPTGMCPLCNLQPCAPYATYSHVPPMQPTAMCSLCNLQACAPYATYSHVLPMQPPGMCPTQGSTTAHHPNTPPAVWVSAVWVRADVCTGGRSPWLSCSKTKRHTHKPRNHRAPTRGPACMPGCSFTPYTPHLLHQ